MEKAAVYLRISKEDLDREGDSHSKSIENQRIIVTDYALKHGWSIQQYYVDDDYSGLYYERPAFSQMLKDASIQNIYFIVCFLCLAFDLLE